MQDSLNALDCILEPAVAVATWVRYGNYKGCRAEVVIALRRPDVVDLLRKRGFTVRKTELQDLEFALQANKISYNITCIDDIMLGAMVKMTLEGS